MQTAYYDSTKASRFIRAGFSPAVVNLALAYNAANRGDESQVSTTCLDSAGASELSLSLNTTVATGGVTGGSRHAFLVHMMPAAHQGMLCFYGLSLVTQTQQFLLTSLLPCLLLACLLVQIMTFCENLKTLTDDMSFGLALAAGALMDAKNDLSAAANLCTELS